MVRSISAALTVISAASVLAACSSTSSAPVVSVPPAAASPERVARIYLRAALTGDCDVTAELTTPGTWNWCSDPKLLNYRSVGTGYHVPASEAGRNEECVGFEMYTHGSSDGSLPAGWQPWSLCFIRTHAGWRVYDQGQG
jgi:hypothetical protein